MVSPSTLERPRSAEPRKPTIRWWTVLAIVIILALLFTNALAWYLLAVERAALPDRFLLCLPARFAAQMQQ